LTKLDVEGWGASNRVTIKGVTGSCPVKLGGFRCAKKEIGSKGDPVAKSDITAFWWSEIQNSGGSTFALCSLASTFHLNNFEVVGCSPEIKPK